MRNRHGRTPAALLLIPVMIAGALLMILYHGRTDGVIREALYGTPKPEKTEAVPTAVPAEELPEDRLWEAPEEQNADTAVCSYGNSPMVTDVRDGCSFYLGSEMIPKDTGDGIYLSPSFCDSTASADRTCCYGYIIRTASGIIEYPETAVPETSENGSGGHYYITGRTYDTLVPASYENPEQYGVRWRSGVSGERSETDCADAVLYIHIVRLSDGCLMGAVRADIVYDRGQDAYRVGSLASNDVSAAGVLSETDREALIASAAEYLRDGAAKIRLPLSEEYLDAVKPLIIAEKRDRVLFGRFFSSNGDVQSAGKYSGCDIYAVHIPYTGCGYLTVYYAPHEQLLGFSEVLSGEITLTVIGYDAVRPFSREEFRMFLSEEDAGKFGI